MIPVSAPEIGEDELNNVSEVIRSTWISSIGEFIPRFEKLFSEYCGAKNGISTCNGTAALHLALTGLDIQSGDEVIVPSLTFVATANAVKYTGAKPVFVDSQRDYWCIDPDKIEGAITAKTKAIIPVHLYGHPCDMSRILQIAGKYNLCVIEDAAEAHGAKYYGQRVGSFGDVNCFSFYGNKIITTGEGGMCLTNNDEVANKLRKLRDHGMCQTDKYWHDTIGFNYRLTNMQAAIGVAQIKRIDEFIKKKKKIAVWYSESLSELHHAQVVKLHPCMSWADCVYWMYSILIEDGFGLSRDNVIKELEIRGVDCRRFFYPLHLLPMYKDSSNDNCPNAEEIARKGLNLPSGVGLTREDVQAVSAALIDVYKHNH